MSEQVKRYVAPSLSRMYEESARTGFRVVLASDYDRVESDRVIHAESAREHIAENIRLRGRIDALEGGDRQMAECCEHYEAKNTALDAALTEVCEERDKYHEDYTRLRGADKALMDGMQRECADAHNRLTIAEGLLQEATAFMHDLSTGRFGVAVNASYQTKRIDAFLKRSE